MHEEALGPEKDPGMHAEHVAAPVAADVPATQAMHVFEEEAPRAPEAEPAAQGMHAARPAEAL